LWLALGKFGLGAEFGLGNYLVLMGLD
jgi:hypothetical protein